MEETKVKKSLKNIAISFTLLILGFVMSFIYRKLFVKVFDVQYLGVVSLFGSVITMLSLAELGFSAAVMYSLYKPLAEKNNILVAQIIRYFRKIYYVICAVVLAIGLCMTPLLPYIIKNMPVLNPSVYIMFMFYLAGTGLSYLNAYKTTLLLADQKEYVYKTVASAVRIGSQFIIIGLLFFIKSFYVVLILENIVVVVQNIILTFIVNKKYPYLKENKDTIGKDMKKSILKYTGSMFTHKLGGVILSITDVMLIAIFFGAGESGYYSNYLLLTASINGIVGIVYSGLQASIGQIAAVQDKKRVNEIFQILNLVCIWLSFFSAIGVFFVSDSLVMVWLGREYTIGKFYLCMISLAFLLENLARSHGMMVGATGVFNKTAYLSIVYALSNLVFSVIFIKVIGLPGVFLGTVAARVAVYPIEIYYLHKFGLETSAKRYYAKFALGLFVGMIGIAAMYGLSYVSISNKYGKLAFDLTMALIVPNIIFLACYARTKEFKALITMLKVDKLIAKIFKRGWWKSF